MKLKWWGKLMAPMQKVWTKVSYRLGYRKTGLIKLHQDVRTCEYEDVHILWDMLKRNETDLTRRKKGPFWDIVQWAKHAPFPCRGASSL